MTMFTLTPLLWLILALAGTVGVIGVVSWYYWRRVRLAAAPVRARALTTPTSAPAVTLWRPPPREQLLRRQEALARLPREQPRYHSADGSAAYHAPARAHVDLTTRRTGIAAARVPTAAMPEMAAVSPLPPTAARPPRVSRIARQRQGLESLITELAPTAELPPYDAL